MNVPTGKGVAAYPGMGHAALLAQCPRYEPNVLVNSGADTKLPDLGDERLGFSFHVYCLAGPGSGAGEPSDPGRDNGCGTAATLVLTAPRTGTGAAP